MTAALCHLITISERAHILCLVVLCCLALMLCFVPVAMADEDSRRFLSHKRTIGLLLFLLLASMAGVLLLPTRDSLGMDAKRCKAVD